MNPVWSVSFSPDGQTLASGSWDQTVHLWETDTGRHLHTLTGHMSSVDSVAFFPDGNTLASGSRDETVRLWDLALTGPESKKIVEDVNGDGVVNIIDLTLVAAAFGNTTSAPEIWSRPLESTLTRAEVEAWLREARLMNLTDPAFQREIAVLEQLLAAFAPKETALLANYPNPFNPETWILYQLASPADVNISIYAVDGTVVRTLSLGHQPIGMYHQRSRAAYWDGKTLPANLSQAVSISTPSPQAISPPREKC